MDVEKNQEEIKKGELTKVQKEILERIPLGKWCFEYDLNFNQCHSYKNVSSQLGKIYEKGYLERRCSKNPEAVSPWLFDYKVKEENMDVDKKIKELKKEMLEWRDFYEQDIVQTDKIKNATTIKELHDIMQEHRDFLELQATDAQTALDRDVDRMFKGFELYY